MDGSQFLEEIKKDKDFLDVPVIFMTAKTASAEKIDGITRGAVAYITKPFDIEELKALIHSILENRENMFENLKNGILSSLNRKERNNFKEQKNRRKPEDLFFKYKITEREKDICLLITQGLQNKEIADRLSLSENYIGKKITEIMKKTGAANRVEILNKLTNR